MLWLEAWPQLANGKTDVQRLQAHAEAYAAATPQGAIVVPPKGQGLDRSECSVLLSRPGVGDAVPCFQ